MIHLKGPYFKDEYGRTLILRGVNLGGSSKVPSRPNGATYIREGFYDHHNVSFVGRPCPLDEADEHFARLRAWGFTFLRFLTTWEAVEHAGPGLYDQEYLDYLYQIVRKAGEHGIELFIDPHQDVWSRMSGGDGAPGWTFEAVGMNVNRFSEVGAAIVHAIHGDPFPRMIWPTNYSKFAAATMFTLFFGGNDFAPRTKVDGEPVQEFLQRHYINAIKQIALRLKDLPNVVGYDTMNEPSPGFIGWADLNQSGGMLRLGESPTPFQSMLLGAGLPQEVEVWSLALTGARRRGRKLVNPNGLCVWCEGHDCVWRENGVWDVDNSGRPRLLRPDHFVCAGGRQVEFANDYLRPFLNRYAREMRTADPDAIIFIEEVPGQLHLRWERQDAPKVVNADHWYDGLTPFTKNFHPSLGVDFETRNLVLGRKRVQQSFIAQLARIKNWAVEQMGGIPTLVGEFGIPFDLQDKHAYRTGDFSRQVQAMDASFRAVEANLLSYNLWNYTADNDNRHGDQWNDEDFSIFSRDQQPNANRDVPPGRLYEGGRALPAVLRPYARAIAGQPLRMAFDYRHRTFEFEFRHDPTVSAPTEIFVPNYQYPDGYIVKVSDGTYKVNRDSQTLTYRHSMEREVHRICVKPQ